MSEQINNTNGLAAGKGKRKGGPAITSGTLKTAKRLLGYVTSTYRVQFIVCTHLYPDELHSVHFCVAVIEIPS